MKHFTTSVVTLILMSATGASQPQFDSSTSQNSIDITPIEKTSSDNSKTDNSKTDNSKTDNSKTDNSKTADSAIDDSVIDRTMCVAFYNYTCNTMDNNEQPSQVKYRLALQVGKKVACSMGLAQLTDTLPKERLFESQYHIPRVYQGYPQGKMTAHEVMPFDRFITYEDMGIQWHLINEYDSILSLPCQKAEALYHGRTWTVWFTHQIPSPYGPWRLHGLPGLILKAQADGVHEFECYQIDLVSEPIVMQDYQGTKTTHDKYIKHRNKKLSGDLSLDNMVPISQVESVTVMNGNVLVNNIPMIDTKHKYQPLELE